MNLYSECLICGAIKIIAEEYFKGHEWCNNCGDMTPQMSRGIPKEENETKR